MSKIFLFKNSLQTMFLGLFFCTNSGVFAQHFGTKKEAIQQLEKSYIAQNYPQTAAQAQTLAKNWCQPNTADLDDCVCASALGGVALLKDKRPKEAYLLFKTAEALSENKTLSATAQLFMGWYLGVYHLSYKEDKIALPFLQKAIQINQKNPTGWYAQAQIHEALGWYYYQKSDYVQALPLLEKACAAHESQPTNEIQYVWLGETKFLVGNAYEKNNQLPEALAIYKQLLAQPAQLLQNNPQKISELAYRLGRVYFRQQETDTARIYLEQAIETKALLKPSLADADLMLALIWAARKETQQALELSGQALISYPNASPLELFTRYMLFAGLGKQDEANERIFEKNYKEAINAPTDWQPQTELQKFKQAPVQHLQNSKLDKIFNIALLGYKHAETQVSKLPKPDQTVPTIEVLMAQGALFYESKHLSIAKSYYEKALALMRTVYPDKHPLVAQANSALGEIYAEEKSFAEALTYVDKAVEASLAKGANLSPEGLPDIHTADFSYELLYALGVKANILRDLQGKNASVEDLQKSLKVYDLSIALLKKLQKTYKRGTNKYQIAELGQRFALEALKTCILLYDRTQKAEYQRLGFMYSEFSKSILLVEALSELRSRQIQGLPAEFLDTENELKQQQNFLETEIYYEVKKGKKSDVVRLAALRKQLGYVQTQYQTHLAQAQQKYPQYYQLRYEINTADIPTVQQNLDPAEALLEYSVLNDSALVVFIVTKNEFRWHRQNLPFGLAKKIIEWKGNNKKYLLDLVKVSYELYQQLIEPLSLNLQTTRLRIIPDAELHYLPFDALNTQLLKPTNEQSFQFLEKHTFLMYKYSCVYNYTATVWLEYRKLEQKNTDLRTILGIAPDFSLSQANTTAFAAINNNLGSSFGDIPAARAETNHIVSLLKGDSIMGLAATETIFKQKAAAYRILHLATHGSVNTQNPLYSAIILMGDETNDGLLHAHELYNLQLSAELVVLSACETGAGKLAKGEGIASIARAFAYAGAPNVVMSMWAAVDDIARLVMERFYIKLEEGLPKDQALQQAKLEVYDLLPNEGRMPYYWAGFVLIGDTSPLQMNPPKRWYFWLAGALGLAGFVGLGMWLRKKDI